MDAPKEQVISEEPEELRGGRSPEEAKGLRLIWTSLVALGVVFGDIGTSPLYALRNCLQGTNAFAATDPDVLGILSLIFWSLMLIVSVKYLLYILRADICGEGGILALMALVVRS